MSYLARLKAKFGEKPQLAKLTELTKGPSVSFVSAQGDQFCQIEDANDPLPESIRDAVEERAAACADVVPAPYLDAWARLNHQKPMRVSDLEWRRALDDGGRFFDAWGALAADLQWTTAELLDLPGEGRKGGLIWQLRGSNLEVLGADLLRTSDGRKILRGVAEWQPLRTMDRGASRK